MRRTSLILLALAGCHQTPPATIQEPPRVTADNADGSGMMAHITLTAQNDEFLYQERVYPLIMACTKNKAIVFDKRLVSSLNAHALAELKLARAAYHAKKMDAWAQHHGEFYRTSGKMVSILMAATGTKIERKVAHVLR